MFSCVPEHLQTELNKAERSICL